LAIKDQAYKINEMLRVLNYYGMGEIIVHYAKYTQKLKSFGGRCYVVEVGKVLSLGISSI